MTNDPPAALQPAGPEYSASARLEQEVQDWQLLHALGKSLLAATSLDAQLDLILQCATTFLRCGQGMLSLYEPATNSLLLKTSQGLSAAGAQQLARMQPGDGACGTAFVQKKRVTVADTQTDPQYADYRAWAAGESIRAVFSTPFFDLHGAALGVMSVFRSQAGLPTERELRLIDICISYLAPIVERKNAEDALKLEKKWSEKILGSIGEGFLVMDSEFRIRQINTEGLRLSNMADASEVIGRSHWDVWPGSEKLPCGQAYKRVLAERISVGARTRYEINGAEACFDLHAYPAFGGIIVFFRDITEQHANEEALKDSQRRLEQLANTIPQMAWMADTEGNVHWYNGRWYEYTGTTEQDMQGAGWQAVHHPDALPWVLNMWTQSIAADKKFEMTFPLRGADGTYRPFLTLVRPLKDPLGNITQWFGTNTDVSALQAAELALKNSEERLQEGLLAGQMAVWEWDTASDRIDLSVNAPSVFGDAWFTASSMFQQVHADDQPRLQAVIGRALADQDQFRTVVRMVRRDNGTLIHLDFRGKVATGGAQARLQPNGGVLVRGICIDVSEQVRAEENLRQANVRKDDFLAMLAHELRNPLAPISIAAQMLRQPGIQAEHIYKASEVITRQVSHMTDLVDDLLDVSRVTRGLVTLHNEAVDVRAALGIAIEQSRPLVDARRHNLLVDLPPDDACVFGDQTRLVQIFANLINNAAKYTPENGEIRLTVAVQPDWVEVTVGDNGVGMDVNLLPHVFDLFSQGARTPDRSQGGPGLGLALVKSLAALHGGSVGVSSGGLGKGSAFSVHFPRIAPVAPAQAPERRTPDPQAAAMYPLRLLVVDDHVDAALTLKDLLEAHGHKVTVRHDGPAAIERFDNRFDACILDIGLPQMDGYELVKNLIARSTEPAPLFVALTGYGQDSDKRRAATAGFDHHFVKPVNSKELFAVLSQIVARQT